MFDYGVDDPDRLACSIFLHNPDEADKIVLDFLNRALFVQDHKRAALWCSVLREIEKMRAAGAPDNGREMRLAA